MRRYGGSLCIALALVVALPALAGAAPSERSKGKEKEKEKHGLSAAVPGKRGNGNAYGLLKKAAAGSAAAPARTTLSPARARPEPKAVRPRVAAEVEKQHVTICHATGSGKYNVLTLSQPGAINGHLHRHDGDFVAGESGCATAALLVAATREEGGSERQGPALAAPRERAVLAAAPLVTAAEALPFTGLPAGLLALAGASLLGAGLGLRRRRLERG